MTHLCRVFGNPISQSKSPLIHALFAKQFDLDLKYDKCTDGLEAFEDAVSSFFNETGSVGANVTLPFKQRAYDFADSLSSHALRSGAVNTLFKRDGSVFGDNTDGRGLVWDLRQNGVDLGASKVLLIGAGGAAKGCIPALFDAGIEKLDVSNRTLQKAQLIVDEFKSDTNWALALHNETEQYDLIINATSLSLQDCIPDLPKAQLKAAKACYDMVYLDRPTAFLKLSKELGVHKSIDGIGMLVGQAAESFKLWFNLMPDVEKVMSEIRAYK